MVDGRGYGEDSSSGGKPSRQNPCRSSYQLGASRHSDVIEISYTERMRRPWDRGSMNVGRKDISIFRASIWLLPLPLRQWVSDSVVFSP